MKKLFLICGHGDGDSGAVGGGYKEADLVRQLAKEMKRQCPEIEVGDTTKNWYKSSLIEKNGAMLKNFRVLELHMDSAGPTAKGAHVIISSKYDADTDDKALAQAITDIFPGRASKIVKRSDLKNVNVSARLGINYRLVECGFISNAADRTFFINNLQFIAKEILKSFGYKPHEQSAPIPSGTLYKVQVGAYKDKKNAEKMLATLKAKGFSGYIKKE